MGSSHRSIDYSLPDQPGRTAETGASDRRSPRGRTSKNTEERQDVVSGRLKRWFAGYWLVGTPGHRHSIGRSVFPAGRRLRLMSARLGQISPNRFCIVSTEGSRDFPSRALEVFLESTRGSYVRVWRLFLNVTCSFYLLHNYSL